MWNKKAIKIEKNSKFGSRKSWQKQLPEVFSKKAVLNFGIFTGKTLFWDLSLIKLQVSRPQIFKNTYSMKEIKLHFFVT